MLVSMTFIFSSLIELAIIGSKVKNMESGQRAKKPHCKNVNLYFPVDNYPDKLELFNNVFTNLMKANFN